ncbi:MAG TPA: hypothetical protein VFY94_09610 [Rhodanobacteraceae bacterium]|nr:hypothetical protein [Rhodanobacteraceae bacterium]
MSKTGIDPQLLQPHAYRFGVNSRSPVRPGRRSRRRRGDEVNSTVQPGRLLFAAAMTALGITGFVNGDFALVWQNVPAHLPGRTVLAYVCAVIEVVARIGSENARGHAVPQNVANPAASLAAPPFSHCATNSTTPAITRASTNRFNQ